MRKFPRSSLPTISWNTERGTLPTIRILRDGKDQAPRRACGSRFLVSASAKQAAGYGSYSHEVLYSPAAINRTS